MLANAMKKGQKGRMKATGWPFEIVDNKKGIIRMARVFGDFDEIGSIYIDDIDTLTVDGIAEKIEFSESQEKQLAKKNNMGKLLGW